MIHVYTIAENIQYKFHSMSIEQVVVDTKKVFISFSPKQNVKHKHAFAQLFIHQQKQ